jgi:hypothetical protein
MDKHRQENQMTTFTLQDLTPNDTPTREEEEAMIELGKATLEKMGEGKSNTFVENPSTTLTIQGATGAQYTPMDTSPEAQQNQQAIEQLLNNLTYTIQAIIKLSVEKYKQPVSSSEGLREAVDTVLEQAQWFDEKVKEIAEGIVEDNDFSYEIESAVETHFSNSFCLEDHLDVVAEIESIVDDKLDDMVQEKVEEILREKLSTATISFN